MGMGVDRLGHWPFMDFVNQKQWSVSTSISAKVNHDDDIWTHHPCNKRFFDNRAHMKKGNNSFVILTKGFLLTEEIFEQKQFLWYFHKNIVPVMHTTLHSRTMITKCFFKGVNVTPLVELTPWMG